MFALCIFFVSVFPLREVISLCISISQVNCHLEQPYVETKKKENWVWFYSGKGLLYRT